MARNPTPLIVPCHRVVSVRGRGVFSPLIEIKEELLEMERKGAKKNQLKIRAGDSDLTRFVDSVNTDLPDFDNYHALRKGLKKEGVR
jgi:hypothetical protein